MTTGPTARSADRHNPVEIGVALNDDLLIADGAERRSILNHISEVGLGHITVGDHVSFHGGAGFDGMVAATSILAGHDTLQAIIGVYQLALRHPMIAARQLATLSQIAPGRLVLGAGVGGEDRSEVVNAGVDPATRGRRLDEALSVLRRLATGEPIDHDGEFFTLRTARILPPPTPRVPIVIGGSGDVAVRRTADHGDGWMGIFCSARRFGETVEKIRAAAAERSREVSWFGLSMWVGLGRDDTAARRLLGERMQSLYSLPPEKFRHVTAAGTPETVAAALEPYLTAGARHLTLVVASESVHEGIEMAGEVRSLLNARTTCPEGSAR
ncbi:LLM class flavin-dependent oxidoreductase [Streptomyces sp. NPDC057199]|uniref:LLM class flavin-dependent oxidoreductase n=1 Tax=Streptomyces sp. NPDC057199 TaxID=3346047 RepID=UPI00363BEB5D